MTRRTATLHLWRLKRAGYEAELRQFSPDRSGWGIAVHGETLKTVASCELTERVKPVEWDGLLNAIRMGQ